MRVWRRAALSFCLQVSKIIARKVSDNIDFIFCYLLTRYWFRAGRYTPVKDIGKLRFGSKTAFAMTHFWNAVDDAKELPIESVKGGMGSVSLDSAEEKNGPAVPFGCNGSKEDGTGYGRKSYRMKENM